MTKAIAIASGGLDSTTLVYHLMKQGYEVRTLSFDYGQRHRKELLFAAMTARALGIRHDVVDLSGLTYLISNSALTSFVKPADWLNAEVAEHMTKHVIEVPDGHYAEENMKLTVVPNRNMIMLSIAAGVAVNDGADLVCTGVHAGDHFVYPDCRPDFIEAVDLAVKIGNEGFGPFADKEHYHEGLKGNYEYIWAPFLHWEKADIAYRALELGVPLHMTWSCYKGGEKHCGRCGTCVERLEAIDIALGRFNDVDRLAKDATEYDDTEFWKQTIREGAQA